MRSVVWRVRKTWRIVSILVQLVDRRLRNSGRVRPFEPRSGEFLSSPPIATSDYQICSSLGSKFVLVPLLKIGALASQNTRSIRIHTRTCGVRRGRAIAFFVSEPLAGFWFVHVYHVRVRSQLGLVRGDESFFRVLVSLVYTYFG